MADGQLERGRGRQAWDALTIENWLKTHDVSDAKELFLRFMPVAKISETTGLPLEVIRFLTNSKGEWMQERTALTAELKEGVKQHTLSQLKQIAHIGLKLIQAGLDSQYKRFVEGGIAPNLEETALITGIVKSLHHAKMEEERDNGKDTRESLSPQQILSAFKDDPYLLPALLSQDTTVYTKEEAEKADAELLGLPDVEISHTANHGDILGPKVRADGEATSGAEQNVAAARGTEEDRKGDLF